jgi:agmatinase
MDRRCIDPPADRRLAPAKSLMKTLAVAFPFDLFGSAGAGTGAQLLADALREMLADAKAESRPARSRAYRGRIQIREVAFETLADYSDWRGQARRIIREALRRAEFVLWLGGNHLGALPVYEELGAAGDALVIQLDAHLDIYNLSDCTTELSHGNFLLHAEGPLPSVVNVGHRDLFLPADYVGRHYARAFSAAEVNSRPDAVVEQLTELSRAAGRVWIDLDCDFFDPAYFPAVAGPLPFGVVPAFLLQLLAAIWSPRVAGLAISEFEPGRDAADRSLGTLIWLLEWVLLRRHETRKRP